LDLFILYIFNLLKLFQDYHTYTISGSNNSTIFLPLWATEYLKLSVSQYHCFSHIAVNGVHYGALVCDKMWPATSKINRTSVGWHHFPAGQCRTHHHYYSQSLLQCFFILWTYSHMITSCLLQLRSHFGDASLNQHVPSTRLSQHYVICSQMMRVLQVINCLVCCWLSPLSVGIVCWPWWWLCWVWDMQVCHDLSCILLSLIICHTQETSEIPLTESVVQRLKWYQDPESVSCN
jgi:hypothetical protein